MGAAFDGASSQTGLNCCQSDQHLPESLLRHHQQPLQPCCWYTAHIASARCVEQLVRGVTCIKDGLVGASTAQQPASQSAMNALPGELHLVVRVPHRHCQQAQAPAGVRIPYVYVRHRCPAGPAHGHCQNSVGGHLDPEKGQPVALLSCTGESDELALLSLPEGCPADSL